MNLNELWHYDDPVDRWAAEHELALRSRAFAREQVRAAYVEAWIERYAGNLHAGRAQPLLEVGHAR